MCGILISKRVERYKLLLHRGIEESHFDWFDYRCFHTRLPLQTIKGDNYKQPLNFKDGLILYNGEIFNYNRGEYYNDCEYLIDFFNKQREGIFNLEEINQWDGFWSIVLLYNSGNIYLFTDPIGKKQLYYNSDLEICSEIKPLLKTGFVFDELYFTSILQNELTKSDLTSFKGIKRILPNQIYIIKNNGIYIYQKDYFNFYSINGINLPLKSIVLKAVVTRYINLLNRNTLLISGGLDSTIILSIIMRLDNNFEFITIENQQDFHYIKIVEDFYGIEIRRIKFEPADDREALFINESPLDLGSVSKQMQLCKEVKGSVIFTGDGADELFGGYKRAKLSDTQNYDIFTELPYYHMPRLDRMSMWFTKELRSPFLSFPLIAKSLNLKKEQRTNKEILKSSFYNDLPSEVLEREKEPLRDKVFNLDRKQFLKNRIELFKNIYNDKRWEIENIN